MGRYEIIPDQKRIPGDVALRGLTAYLLNDPMKALEFTLSCVVYWIYNLETERYEITPESTEWLQSQIDDQGLFTLLLEVGNTIKLNELFGKETKK